MESIKAEMEAAQSFCMCGVECKVKKKCCKKYKKKGVHCKSCPKK